MKFDTLFRYRAHYMAIAIAEVVTYHIKGSFPDTPLKTALFLFVGSVDTFFFVSGIGCFFSWRRDRDPAAFLRRRALRILPSYVPFILFWIALQLRGAGIGPTAALANLFGLEGFVAAKPSFNWYISAMWLSYLLTPWLAALAERCDTRLRMAAATAGLVLLTAAFWNDHELIIVVARLPIFFVGMCFAAESRRRESLTRAELAVLLGMMPVGALLLWEFMKTWQEQLWDWGLHWYPFLLIVPGACVLIAALFSLLERCAPGRALSRAAVFLSGFTFEIYLTHLCLTDYTLSLPVFLLLTAAGTALLHLVSRLIRGALEKRLTAQAAL
ncbi:MAG: acyltransferase [Oscillospiraceae bacterium]|nr:acyltransferase [Oscillospiraceae bacterium]